MEVAVVADLQRSHQAPEAGAVHARRHAIGQAPAQRRAGGVELALHARRPRRHVGRRHALGREVRITRITREGQVQLGRAAAESGQRRQRAVAGGQPLQQPAPAVVRVRHEILHHGQRPRPGAIAVLQAAEQPRRVPEGGALGEEARDLDVGIHAGGQPPKVLEDDRVAEEDRRVALLAGQPARRPAVALGRAGAGGHADGLAARAGCDRQRVLGHHARDPARLAGEPALPGDPRRQPLRLQTLRCHSGRAAWCRP